MKPKKKPYDTKKARFKWVDGDAMPGPIYGGKCWFCGKKIEPIKSFIAQKENKYEKYVIGTARMDDLVDLKWVEGCDDCGTAFSKLFDRFVRGKGA